MSSHDYIYRMVLDDFTGENVGVICLDIKKLEDKHWIIDHNGYLRKMYQYETIDKIDYENVIAFETYPELKVKYRPWLFVITKLLDSSWILLTIGIFIATIMFILMGSTMYFVHDPNIIKNMINNSVFEVIFKMGFFCIVIGLPLVLACLYSDSVTIKSFTKRDKQIERWRREQESKK